MGQRDPMRAVRIGTLSWLRSSGNLFSILFHEGNYSFDKVTYVAKSSIILVNILPTMFSDNSGSYKVTVDGGQRGLSS
jgi:hypothetical protein